MQNDTNELLLIWKDSDTQQQFVVGALDYTEANDKYTFS